jgi:hypothetical protein
VVLRVKNVYLDELEGEQHPLAAEAAAAPHAEAVLGLAPPPALAQRHHVRPRLACPTRMYRYHSRIHGSSPKG